MTTIKKSKTKFEKYGIWAISLYFCSISFTSFNMSKFKLDPSLGQIMKGKVSKVNPFLLYFEIDETFRVYTDLRGSPVYLPSLHDDVEVIKLEKSSNSSYTYVMGPETTYNFSKNVCDMNPFLEFLRRNIIVSDVDEVIAMDLIVRKLESFLTECEVQHCILMLYKCLPKIVCGSGEDKDFKKSFKSIEARTVKDLLYANCNSQLYMFLNFDKQCSFNVYHNRTVDKVTDCVSEYLFGILAVAEKHGYFILQNNTSEILVKFTAASENLDRLHNCLVLIKKYSIFTEIYKDLRRPTIHYILLSAPDVTVIINGMDKMRPKLFYGNHESLDVNLKYSYFLEASKISEVIYGYNNSPECWMEASISPKANFIYSEKVYAILPQELLQIVPFLKEQIVYKIYTNQKLEYGKIGIFRELYTMREVKKVLLVASDSIFERTEVSPAGIIGRVFDDFHGVKSSIANTSDYTELSFILKLERKEYQRSPYSSWFPKRHNDITCFGDVDQHQQRLVFRDESSNSFIDLYLTNRDNHVSPLGLVSDMKVKVRHVQVNKRKYLKTNVFTSFEVIDYCPELKFSCANLSFTDRSTWQWHTKTPPTFLGMYPYIPTNCVVHGTVLFRAVLDLRLHVVCATCRALLRDDKCARCKVKEKDVDVYLVVHVQDPLNPAFYIEVDNIHFLLELLGLRNENGVDAFMEECFREKMLEVDFLKISEDHEINDAETKPVFQKVVTVIKSLINYNYFFLMDVVCVRQFAQGRKPWKLVEYEFFS